MKITLENNIDIFLFGFLVGIVATILSYCAGQIAYDIWVGIKSKYLGKKETKDGTK